MDISIIGGGYVGQQEGLSLFPDAKWYDDVYMAAEI